MDSQRNTLQVWHEELCFVDTSAKLLAPPVFWLPARIQAIHYFWTACIFCLRIPHTVVLMYTATECRDDGQGNCTLARMQLPVFPCTLDDSQLDIHESIHHEAYYTMILYKQGRKSIILSFSKALRHSKLCTCKMLEYEFDTSCATVLIRNYRANQP